jgi:hypothetical protein
MAGDPYAVDQTPGPVATMSSKTKKSVSPAERMRLLRTRRRNGLRSLRVTLHDTEIDCLVEKGYLKLSCAGLFLWPRAVTNSAARRWAGGLAASPEREVRLWQPNQAHLAPLPGGAFSCGARHRVAGTLQIAPVDSAEAGQDIPIRLYLTAA